MYPEGERIRILQCKFKSPIPKYRKHNPNPLLHQVLQEETPGQVPGGGDQAGSDQSGARALTDPWPSPAQWPVQWQPGGEDTSFYLMNSADKLENKYAATYLKIVNSHMPIYFQSCLFNALN